MRDLSKREERTSTTSFSAYGRSVLHIPRNQNFNGTESLIPIYPEFNPYYLFRTDN